MAVPKVITTPQSYTVFNLFNPLFTKTTNKFLLDPNTNPPKVTPLRPDGTQFFGFPSIGFTEENEVRKFAGVSTIDEKGNIVPPPTKSAPKTNNPTGTKTPSTNLSDRLIAIKLNYPSDLSKNQTYIKFTSYDFSDVQNTNEVYNVGSGFKDVGNLIGASIGQLEIQPYSGDIIKLYVPPNINVSYGANWGEASLGAAIGSQSADTGNIFGDIAARFLGGSISGLSQTGINQLADTMKDVPGFNAAGEQLFGLTTGLVFNRNEFSTFSNIQMRTFNYSFLLVARSEAEKNSINRIINTFKVGMHPSAGVTISPNTAGGQAAPRIARTPLLKYPKLWTIEYCIGSGGDNDSNNRYLPRTKFCAITSVNVNYTPNSVFTTLTDGAIPAIQMDISFKELTPLTAEQFKVGKSLGGPFTDISINENNDTSSGGTF